MQCSIYIAISSNEISLTLFTGRHLLHVHFVTGLESNLCTAATRYNTTENFVSNN